jgi:hypothetical protein
MTTVQTIESALPVQYDFPHAKQGGDWNWTMQLFENDGVTPIDTTGYTITMRLMQQPNGEAYATLTIASGHVTHTPASGQFNFKLTKAQLAAFDFLEAFADVCYNTGTADVPVLYGKFKIIE